MSSRTEEKTLASNRAAFHQHQQPRPAPDEEAAAAPERDTNPDRQDGPEGLHPRAAALLPEGTSHQAGDRAGEGEETARPAGDRAASRDRARNACGHEVRALSPPDQGLGRLRRRKLRSLAFPS